MSKYTSSGLGKLLELDIIINFKNTFHLKGGKAKPKIKMTKFEKKDIAPLDFIINKLIKFDSQIVIEDLIKNDFIIDDDSIKPYAEYNRLASILHSYNCADVFFSGEIDFGTTIRVNKNTSNFVSQGGFKNAYNEMTAEKEHSLVIRAKELNDAKLSKWQVKYFWYIFVFGLLGGIYSTVEIIKSLSTSENVKEKQVSKEEMELELSKLRTLILNQKRDTLIIPTNSEKGK